MSNLSFPSNIVEAMTSGSAEKASFIIAKYLQKKTGLTFFKSAGVEVYQNDSGNGRGIRFFTTKGGKSLRFNWSPSNSIGLTGLSSVDFWNGESDKPYHIEFDKEVSLVKTLPVVADIVSSGGYTGEINTMPDGVPLDEARGDTPESVLDGIINMLSSGPQKKGDIKVKYSYLGLKIFDQLLILYPDDIVKVGVNYEWQGKPKQLQSIARNLNTIMDSIGIVTGNITKGSAKETYEDIQDIDVLETKIDRLTFEQQLADLEHLLKLTISGASNALFVAGRGGCLSADTKINATLE